MHFFSYQYGFFFSARFIFTHCFCLFIVSFLETVTFLLLLLSFCMHQFSFSFCRQSAGPCVKCPALTELPGRCGTGPMIQKKTECTFPIASKCWTVLSIPPTPHTSRAVGHDRPICSKQNKAHFYFMETK